MYLNMYSDSSAKYYQDDQERLKKKKKKSWKISNSPSRSKKGNNVVVKGAKLSQKMINKSWLSIKEIIKSENNAL